MYLLRCPILLAWSSILSGALSVALPRPKLAEETAQDNANLRRKGQKKWSLKDAKLFSPEGAATFALTGAGLVKLMGWRTKLTLEEQQKKHEHELWKANRDSYDEGTKAGAGLTLMEMCYGDLEKPLLAQLEDKVLPESVQKTLWDECLKKHGLSSDPQWAFGSTPSATIVIGRQAQRDHQKAVDQFYEGMRDVGAIPKPKPEPKPESTPQGRRIPTDDRGNNLNFDATPLAEAGKTFMANAPAQLAAMGESFKKQAPGQVMRMGAQMYRTTKAQALQPG
ncbi:MAG: hypothetical protein M1823_004088 [Watsoniomyces obsoletus]|nr:MAG: hypothetical protein M1823_004088 [Watsoniomyces obsoletus]